MADYKIINAELISEVKKLREQKSVYEKEIVYLRSCIFEEQHKRTMMQLAYAEEVRIMCKNMLKTIDPNVHIQFTKDEYNDADVNVDQESREATAQNKSSAADATPTSYRRTVNNRRSSCRRSYEEFRQSNVLISERNSLKHSPRKQSSGFVLEQYESEDAALAARHGTALKDTDNAIEREPDEEEALHDENETTAEQLNVEQMEKDAENLYLIYEDEETSPDSPTEVDEGDTVWELSDTELESSIQTSEERRSIRQCGSAVKSTTSKTESVSALRDVTNQSISSLTPNTTYKQSKKSCAKTPKSKTSEHTTTIQPMREMQNSTLVEPEIRLNGSCIEKTLTPDNRTLKKLSTSPNHFGITMLSFRQFEELPKSTPKSTPRPVQPQQENILAAENDENRTVGTNARTALAFTSSDTNCTPGSSCMNSSRPRRACRPKSLKEPSLTRKLRNETNKSVR